MVKMDAIETINAPKAIGPYSQAALPEKAASLVFCSGQIAIEPKTNRFRPGSVSDETEQAILNLKAVLEAAGSSLEKAVKVTVYLTDMSGFSEMNSVYERYFTKKPARSAVGVAALPRQAKVEIDVIAEI